MNEIKLPVHIQALLACWKDFADRYADLPPPLPVVEVELHLDELAGLLPFAEEQFKWLQDWNRRLVRWASQSLAERLAQPDTPEQVMWFTAAKIGDFADELVYQREVLKVHFQGDAAGMSALAARLDVLCHVLLRKLLDFAADIGAAMTPEALAAATRQDGQLALEFTLSLGCDEGIEQLRQWLEAQQKAVNIQEFSAADWLFVAVVLIGTFLFLVRFGSEGVFYLIVAILAIAALVFIIRYPLLVLLAIIFGVGIGS
ncbi:hypothetical protein CO613_03740 [Lysobacteraceae bacterium NML07-0707]|nr:hypothetical protein CO613_03740 [Xanthomonadaceae bacterium NML07-0707]